MRQIFQCINCDAPVGIGAEFCGNCGHSLNWSVQQPIQRSMQNWQEDPSMHIVPLNYSTKEPVLYYVENKLNLPAIAAGGRLSWLSAPDNLTPAIHTRIQERYPPREYNGVQSYVMCAVDIGQLDVKQKALIFDVWGFWEHFKEVDELYNTLYSLGSRKVGDVNWNQSLQYISSDPIMKWIDTLILFLKGQLNWRDYVHKALEQLH
ncbi:MAG: hypothetical protein ACYDHZ_09045 [Dehalococcoidia bacterium]